ncbi:MAG: hypothetical protein LBU23_10795, partial [Planctomycetota bacterium]|nr:hypothetical protein [Planctomycetota bacterium]
EAAGTEEGERFRLGAYGERTPAEEAIFDLWEQPSGEGGLDEVLRKAAELEKIAIAERKAKMAKCPPIEKTEEAEAAAEAPEKQMEMPKTEEAAPKPETAKCPPIGKTEEAEPAAKPAARLSAQAKPVRAISSHVDKCPDGP